MDKAIWNFGFIKFFDSDKGFGFITSILDRKDYFVHQSKLKATSVKDNDKVIFCLTQSKKKPDTLEAINVKLLQSIKDDQSALFDIYSRLSSNSHKRDILKYCSANTLIDIFDNEMSLYAKFIENIDYDNILQKTSTLKEIFSGYIPNEDLNEIISQVANKIVNSHFRIRLWLDNIINTQPNLTEVIDYFKVQNIDTKKKIYLQINPSDRHSLFSNYIQDSDFSKCFQDLIFFLNIENDPVIQKKKYQYNSCHFELKQDWYR